MSGPNIVIREYDPAWPRLFEGLRERLLDAPGGLAVAVEHVGSTAVPGLAAKPVVDIDAVVASAEDVPAVERLERAGYRHEGDLGIPGREAFEPPAGAPWHHLYVLPADSEELRRHLAFRDHLRDHPQEQASTYADLKREAARRFGGDRRAYTDAKGEFVEHILSRETGAR